MKPRFKSKHLQYFYQAMLALAADKTSELYVHGKPRYGAAHRVAFWAGYSGKYTLTGARRHANVVPNTLSHACFAAGREFARQQQSKRSGR